MFPFWRGTNLDSSTGYRNMICISSSKTWSSNAGVEKKGFAIPIWTFAVYRHSKSSIVKHWIHVCVCLYSCAGTVHDCVNFAWVGVFNAMPLWNGFEQTFGYRIGIFLYSKGPLPLQFLNCMWLLTMWEENRSFMLAMYFCNNYYNYIYWHSIIQYIRFPFIHTMKIRILLRVYT